MDTLSFKRHNSFPSESNGKVAHDCAPRILIFKLQQEVLKLNDLWVRRSSPKADLVTNFLNLENRSFENFSFSQ